MIEFLHNFVPNPIIWQWGILTIHWYGVFIVSGILAGLVVITQLAKKYRINPDEIYNLGFYAVIFGLVGARVYSVFLDLSYYRQHPLEVFAIWQGGLAIHGAIIGGLATLIFYSYWQGKNFWQLADLAAPAIALGQAIGRWGNYFNQEIFGTPTDLPWGIPIELKNRPLQYLSEQYFHPTFLYESILNLINFAISMFLFYKLQATRPTRLTGGQGGRASYKLKNGVIFLVYLINYSVIRISMEFLRTDVVPLFLGFRVTALVSVMIGLAAIIGLVYRYGINAIKNKKI